MRNTLRRRAAAALLLPATVAAAGCSWWFGRNDPARRPRPLVARNHGHVAVTVHAVPSAGRAGRQLGTVRAYATATLALRRGDLQPGGPLAVRVRAVGADGEWHSPAIAVDPNMLPHLDVHMTSDGDVSRSTLALRPAPGWARASTGADAPGARTVGR